MQGKPKTMLLSYTSGSWSDATISIRLRSLREPAQELPVNAHFTSAPEVLTFEVLPDPDLLRARVKLKPDQPIPDDDKVILKIKASEAKVPAQGAPPLTEEVTVHVFPYKVEYQVLWPDGQVFKLSPGGQLSVPQDGCSKIRITPRIFRVDSSGRSTSQTHLTGFTGRLLEQPASSEITVITDSATKDFSLLVSSNLIKVGDMPSTPIQLLFQLTAPSGRSFTQRLTLQPQPIKGSLSIEPQTLSVGNVQTLEGGVAKLALLLQTCDGRPVSLPYRLHCALGTCSPDSGTSSKEGCADSTYRSPILQEATKAGSQWPRSVTIGARLGEGKLEVANCTVVLTYRRSLTVSIEKVGFQSLHKDLQVTSPGDCRLRVLIRSGGKDEPVAYGRVSGADFAPTTTDQGGYCTLHLKGEGSGQNLGDLKMETSEEVKNFQKQIVDGLKASAGASPSPAYLKAQSDLTNFVMVAYPER